MLSFVYTKIGFIKVNVLNSN